MQVTLAWSPLHSCNLLSRTAPQEGSRSHHFAAQHPLAKQDMPRGPPRHTPSTASPLLSPGTERWGWQSRQGSRWKANPPCKLCSPWLFPVSSQQAGITNASSPRPPLPRGGLPGNRDGTTATPERPGGQWGTVPGSSSPQPLHQQALQTPSRMLIFVAICVPDGASTQPLNTSRLSPIQHPTPGTKAQKIPALADADQPEWSKISSSPACSQGFNSSVRTSVRNCSRSAASPCHVNIQLLLANNSTSVTACGETLQIPNTSAVEKHFPVPALAWDRPCPC